MIDCNIVTGFPFCSYNKIKNAIKKEKGDDVLVFDDSFIKWEKTDENYQNLQSIETKVEEDNVSAIYLVGYLYARHIPFFRDINEFNVSVNVIHTSSKRFVKRFKEKYKTYSLPFFNDQNDKFPLYEEEFEKSPLDFLNTFYYDFDKTLSKINGFHFSEDRLKEKRFVESQLYNTLFDLKDNNFFEFLNQNYEVQNFSPDLQSNVKKLENDNVDLLIASFLLPEEFNLFYKQSQALLRSFDEHLSNINIILRVHLDLSNFYVDWDKSKLDKEILYANFHDLKLSFDPYCKTKFSCFGEIHGCNDIRRDSIRNFSEEVDCFSWLDPDTKFPTNIIRAYEKILPRIDKNYNLYGITPQIFRPKTGYLEPLSVDPNFKFNKPAFENIHRLNKNQRSIKRLNDGFRVNGAFSIISSKLLRMTDIPDKLGYYGNDDIYVNECINIINNLHANNKVALFLVKNLVNYQDESWRENDSLTSFAHKKLKENTAKRENHRKTQSVLDQLYNNFKAKI